MRFQSPTEAATALAQATKDTDEKALTKVLGNEAKALITSGDSESDKTAMQQFFSKYQQMNRWVDMSDGSRVLYIGADNFAFPVPLAKNTSGSWYFDAVAGAQEIRAREIGRNELLTIDTLAALANAEQFYSANTDSGEYAQRIISTAGKQDGLYWPAWIHSASVRWRNSRHFRTHPSRRSRQTKPSPSMGTRCASLPLRAIVHRAERRASS